MPKPKKPLKFLIWGIVALAIGAGVYFKFFRKRESIITVQTEKVTRRNLTEIVIANGKVQPVIQVVINPEVSGEITDLPVHEGQSVKKGDLLVRIKPDYYRASRNSEHAHFKSALAGKTLAQANLNKAEAEFKRIQELSTNQLVSDSALLEAKTAFDVARAQVDTAIHQAAMAQASLDRAEEDLKKTTIVSPIDGTVTKLRSQPGERVVGTAMMAGTEIMTVAALDDMEARVDVNEVDVVLINAGQIARLEVDAFRDRKFSGKVYEIANASKGPGTTSSVVGGGGGGGGQGQEATKFEVKIRITDKELFRPGMSVTAEIETRSRTNVLSVPIQSVTIRAPKSAKKESKPNPKEEEDQNAALGRAPRKKDDAAKPAEVVFLTNSDKAKMASVKRGISDDEYVEIIEGLSENQEVVSGGYKAINRELEDGKKIKIDNTKQTKKQDKDEKTK